MDIFLMSREGRHSLVNMDTGKGKTISNTVYLKGDKYFVAKVAVLMAGELISQVL